MSKLLRERNWAEANKTFAQARDLGVASADEALLCAVLNRVWDFYVLERRRDVWFFADGLKLAGKFYDPPGGSANGTVILSHGSSAWGQSHPFVVMTALELARRGYEVFTFDYRGFNASQDPLRLDSATALFFPHDLAAAIELVRKKNKTGRIILMGHSFGAGPTLVCGFADPAIADMVVVSPARRVWERNLGPRAFKGITELRKRMKADMELDELPSAAAVRQLTPQIIIDRFAGKTFPRPLLILDGEKEKPELRKFLAAIAATMEGPVSYQTIARAPHYFGLDEFRDYFKKRRGLAGEIRTEDIARACGRLCGKKLDMDLFFDYIGAIDSWLKKNGPAPVQE
jgi:pimeloyl-ACP methyl ester carboxylesterase